MSLVHLHRHSEYSLLDGTGTPTQYAKRAAELGQTALAQTDHAVLSGLLHHHRACMQNGIMPIMGVEAYFRPNRLLHDKETNWEYYHIILLAANAVGWRNLIRLTSLSFLDDAYYRKPCIDYALLQEYGEGIVASTSCMSGTLGKSITSGDERGAFYAVQQLQKIFGDRLYLEIMPNAVPQQREINRQVINIANMLGIPFCATADAHYPYRGWQDTQDICLMISTNQTVHSRAAKREAGEDVYQMGDETLYLMSEAEMLDAFGRNHPGIPFQMVQQAIDNTDRIANEWILPFWIDKGQKNPVVQVPEGITQLDMLKRWCEEGLVRIGKSDDQTYRLRYEYELSVIERNGFVSYFIIVGDLVREMKNRGIRIGPGRGSAAGSLISYLCRITNVDPIAHDLLFERFLNPDRPSPPDIDIDIDSRHQQTARKYLAEKYGADHVVLISAFQTFGAKSTLKAVAKVMGVSFAEMNMLTEDIPDGDFTLEDLAKDNEKVAAFREQYPHIWMHATRLEGQVKAMSSHPAGVIITPDPVTDSLPIMRSKKDAKDFVTAWSDRAEFAILTEYGYLKIDILSLASLTTRALAVEAIKKDLGIDIDLDDHAVIPVGADPDAGDPSVFAKFGYAPAGIFQCESDGMNRLMREMHVDHFNDIAAAISLFRPGPMENIPLFVARKTGKESITYPDPRLEPITSNTYGVYVYQEQAMRITRELAGFTGGEAETLRKAIGKKQLSIMQSLEQKFRDGCLANGVEAAVVDDLWQRMIDSARYSFNKSHGVSYGVNSYEDAWLKTYFPLYFYCMLLTTEEKEEKRTRCIREAMAEGCKVLPPDVNTSNFGFTVDGEVIRFGLGTIKGVGDAAVQELYAKRPFTSVEDIRARCEKRKVNAKVMRALIESGACDSLGGREGIYQDANENIILWDEETRSTYEQKLIGFTSGGSYWRLMNFVQERIFTRRELDAMNVDDHVVVGGEVIERREATTRNGHLMGHIKVAFGADTHRMVMFGNAWLHYRDIIQQGEIMLFSGYKDDRGGIRLEHCQRVIDVMKEMEQNAA